MRTVRSTRRRLTMAGFLAVAFTIVAGCEKPPIDFFEVVRLREPLTEADVQKYFRIVAKLPDQRIPAMFSVYAGPPEWPESRTLPVRDLTLEEIEKLNERWRPERLASEWASNRALQRILARERMTLPQFAGLTLSLAAAYSRLELPEQTDLTFLKERGDRQIDLLRNDRRSFAALPEDDRHLVLLQAVWITRHHRAKTLLEVPAENVDLARRHRKALGEMLPVEFHHSPLEGMTDLLEEQGLPFEQQASSGLDEELEWRKEDALIGNDAPDVSAENSRDE